MSKLVDTQLAPKAGKQKPKARPKPGRTLGVRGPAAKSSGPPSKPASKATAKLGAKQILLIEMLKAKRGSNIDAVVKATGWLPHTGRAMISGLRKAGFKVEVEQQEGQKTVYRIVAGPKKAPKARR